MKECQGGRRVVSIFSTCTFILFEKSKISNGHTPRGNASRIVFLTVLRVVHRHQVSGAIHRAWRRGRGDEGREV